MKKSLFNLLLFCLFGVLTAGAQGVNKLKAGDISCMKSASVDMPFFLENTNPRVVALQFEVTVPQGVTISTSSGTAHPELTRTADHQIQIASLGNQRYRVMMLTPTNTLLRANKGKVLSLRTSVSSTADMQEGETYPVTISHVVIVDSLGNDVATDYEDGSITVEPCPDFTVSDISITSGDVAPEGSVSLAWTINNIGTRDSRGGWSEQISFVSDATDEIFHLTTMHYTDALEAGQSAGRSANVAVPRIVGIDGQFHVQIKVVPNSDSGESVEYQTNNTGLSASAYTMLKKLYLTIWRDEQIEEDPHLSSFAATLERSGSRSSEQTFTLQKTAGDNRLVNPATITFDKYSAMARFSMGMVNDDQLNGDIVTFTYNVPAAYGYDGVTASVQMIDDEEPTITITSVKTELNEGEGIAFDITLQRPSNEPLVVKLACSRPERFPNMPASITFQPGETQTHFAFAGYDDDIIDLEEVVTFTASAPRYKQGQYDLNVTDNDMPQLTMTLSKNSIYEDEGSKAILCTIERSGNVKPEMTLRIYDSPQGQLRYPATVVLKKGQTTAEFYIGVNDDAEQQGERDVVFGAAVYVNSCGCTANVWQGGLVSTDIHITDNDTPHFYLTSTNSNMLEGSTENQFVVSRNNTGEAVDAYITCNHPELVQLPSHVTIPAGERSATFNVAVNTNETSGDSKRITFYAKGAEESGYGEGTCYVRVTDQTLPDLEIVSMTIGGQDNISVGDDISVAFDVKNMGYKDAKSFCVRLEHGKSMFEAYYELKAPEESEEGEENVVEPLKPGATLHCLVSVPSNEVAGSYTMRMTVDCNNAIHEIDEQNNHMSADFVIKPLFTATAQADKHIYTNTETVRISGKATGLHPNNADLDVYVINGGMRFVVETQTDEEGNYTAEWTPEGNLAGHFIVGACSRGEGLKREMDAFDMYGMRRYDTGFILSEFETGESKDGYFDIINHGTMVLTDISVTATDMPANATITIDPVKRLRAGNHARVFFHLTGLETSPLANEWQTTTLRLQSKEGAVYEQKIYFYVHSPLPVLKSDIAAINTTMTPGLTRDYPITLRNEGRRETGTITVDLAKFDWLRLATPVKMPSLKQGEETTVVLQLSPSSAMPLNSITTGQIAINYDDNQRGVTIPFRIETVSEETGTLVVDVWDEFTMNTESADPPHVEGATVSVLHPVTQKLLRQAVTGADGLATFTMLNAGNYLVTVTHPKHDSWKQTVMVDPAKTTTQRAFIPYSAITVEMHYEKTEIEDEYNIVTTVTYETNVPKPVVLLDAPDKIILDEIETPYLYYAHLTNVGLITAFDASYHVPSEVNGYRFTPLIDSPKDILPQQTISIPVEITKIDESEEEEESSGARTVGPNYLPRLGGLTSAPKRDPGTAIACGIGQMAQFFSSCGTGGDGAGRIEEHVSKIMQLSEACGGGPLDIGSGGGGGSGALPGGPGGSSPGGGGGDSYTNTETGPTVVACDPWLRDNGKDAIKDLLGGGCPPLGWALSGADVGGGDPTPLIKWGVGTGIKKGAGKLLPKAKDWIEKAWDAGEHAESLFGGSRRADGWDDDEDDDTDRKSGPRKNPSVAVNPSTSISVMPPARFVWKGDDGSDEEGYFDEMVEHYNKKMKQLWLLLEQWRQRTHQTETFDEPLFFSNHLFSEEKPADIGDVEHPASLPSPIKAWRDNTALGRYVIYHSLLLLHEGYGDWGFLYMDPDEMQAVSDSIDVVLANEALDLSKAADRNKAIEKIMFAFPTGLQTPQTVNPETGFYLSPAKLTATRILNTIRKIRGETLDEKAAANCVDTDKILTLSAMVKNGLMEVNRAGYDDEMQLIDAENGKLADYLQQPRSSVCASVKLQIEQKMTMTREAVRGTLTVVNGSEYENMGDVKLNLVVTDQDGNVADSHIMEITTESLSGFTGEKDFQSGWTLAPKGKGVAKILFIPTRYAAPDEPVLYTFAGSISFTDPFTGLPMTRALEPERLTVNPSPVLDLTYLMERDVWGDDALTKEVEPVVPAQFTLIIHNKGKGDATKVKMLTNQPEIVDNEKGLLIDIQIESAQLNGDEKTLALGQSVATDFGTIPAGKSALAQWWLTSSLTGHFTEYDVKATHVTSYDNPDLTLLDQVTIHEMIHQITLPGVPDTSDGTTAPENVAFLVNDKEDYHDAPDQLYTIDGEKTPVCEATDIRWQKASDTRYMLKVMPKTAGWCYGNTTDPTGGLQNIVGIRRSSNDEVLPADNFWQTNRTLVDKMEPIYENLIHFADEMPLTGETYIIDFEPAPVNPLKLKEFEGIPNNEVFSRTPVGKVTVTFDRLINEETFTADDLLLTRAGTPLDVSGLTITKEGEKSFSFDLSANTLLDGYYLLTVQMAGITDANGVAGIDGRQIGWTQVEDGKANLLMVVEPEGAGTVTPGNSRQDFFGDVVLTAAANNGYIFSGWKEGDKLLSTEANYTYTMFGEKTVRALFKPQQFLQNVDWNPVRGTVKGGGSGYYDYNTEVTWTAVPNEGYYFKGWIAGSMYGEVSLTDPTISFTVEGQGYYFAVFEPMQYIDVDLSENNADNASVFAEPHGKYFRVSTDRVLKSWQWNPVCFPFAISEQQINKLWGYATMILEFKAADGQDITVDYVSDMKAGMPYLVKPERDVNIPRLEFNGDNITIRDTPICVEHDGFQFVGNYTPHEWDLSRTDGGAEWYYGVTTHKLYKAKTTTAALKGLRAYFVLPDNVNNARIIIGDEVTGIAEVEHEPTLFAPVRIYNLQGQYLGTNPDRLPRGMYIINGKKQHVR